MLMCLAQNVWAAQNSETMPFHSPSARWTIVSPALKGGVSSENSTQEGGTPRDSVGCKEQDN